MWSELAIDMEGKQAKSKDVFLPYVGSQQHVWPQFRVSLLTSNDLNLRLILPPPMIQIYGGFSHLKGSNQEKFLTGVPSLGLSVNSVQNKTKHLEKQIKKKIKEHKHIAVRSSDLSVNIEENVLSNLWES